MFHIGRKQFSRKQRYYITHSAIGYGSEEIIVNYLLYKLETFGFSLPYTRKYLSRMAIDGQYTSLNVDKHMHEKLQKNIYLSWDVMYRIELASKYLNSVALHKDCPYLEFF